MALIKQLKKKTLPLVFSAFFGISSVIGCNLEKTKIESSSILHEDAVVADVVYTPPRHGEGSGIGPTMDLDGNLGVAVTFVDVDIPETYAVVFECKHGKFISQGTDKRHMNLWEKLKEGQKVDITYKEIYKSTYKDINNDGKKDLISRTLVKYDFLDADIKKE